MTEQDMRKLSRVQGQAVNKQTGQHQTLLGCGHVVIFIKYASGSETAIPDLPPSPLVLVGVRMLSDKLF